MRPLATVILTLLLAAPAKAETITVAAAVSLRDALTDIAARYRSDTKNDVRFTFGSSGQLMAQVRNGAPIDLFISAADHQVDDLAREDLVVERTRRVIAGNTLTLVVPADAHSPPARFTDLADARHKRIALGDPRTVPAGEYALQLLTSLEIADAVSKRTVHATNVRQVLGYVERGEVSAGIVYLTDAVEAAGKIKVIEKADPKLHKPIRYPAVVVKASKKQKPAAQFLSYLLTEPARDILKDRGFTQAPTP